MQKSRTQLVIIMLMAFVSLGGSYALFYYAKTGGSWGTTNHGEFVTPQTSVSDLGWRISGESAQGHWWLWVLADECTAVCQQTVKDLRALHILLNKEADRVRRGFTGDNGAWQSLQDNYPALQQVVVEPVVRQMKRGVYIADPLGNLVFYYPMEVNPKMIQQDLKKLLRVSQIG